MYRLFVLILFCFCWHAGFNQCESNIVRNGGFEELNECPPTLTLEYQQLNERAVGWFNANYNTADVFNTCSPYIAQSNGGGFIPDNYWGFEYPHSGNGYGGLAIVCGDTFGDYLQNELSSALKKGVKYEIEFWVSLADTFDVAETGVYCALRGLQFLFTTEQVFWPDITMMEGYTPQYSTGEVWLNDSIGWMQIKDTIVLEEDAAWMTIGRFNLAEIGVDCDCYPGKFFSAVAYYFIDDISIEPLELSEYSFPTIFSPNGDGKNDFWSIPGWCGPITIYNRWGQKITELENGENWDGSYNSTPASEGVYYCVAINSALNKEQKGCVQLVR